MKERVLVTGGAGYIGSVLSKALLDEGCNLTVLDNFSYNQNTLLDCCSYENFSVVRGDIRDEETLHNAMKNQDYIIHLAALVGAPICDARPKDATSINLDASKLILSLRTKNQKILYPCTNSGYGVGEKGKFCTEKTPLRPISLYGKTKVEAEKAILNGGNSISFRLATVFGVSPRMRIDLLVNNFVYRAVNDKSMKIFEGNFKRNYIHIRDVARVFLFGIKNFDKMSGEVFNVGLSEANLSKLDLCEKIKSHLPDFEFMESNEGEDPDKRDYVVSNEKIEKIGFKTRYSLEMGIQELIKCYKIIKEGNYANV